MLNLTGTVINVFTQQGGTNKKGESFEDRDKVQLLGALDLPNGEIKNELITLTVDNYRDFKDLLNKKNFYCCWCNGNGSQCDFYVAKGAQPQILPEY